MVAHYSVAKVRRAVDEYTPGGVAGKRPDRSATVYTRLAKQAYPDLPVILEMCIRDRPQTMRYFEQMQERITGFVERHSAISEERFVELMMHTGELVMDVGTVLTGEQAVKEGLIDQMLSLIHI